MGQLPLSSLCLQLELGWWHYRLSLSPWTGLGGVLIGKDSAWWWLVSVSRAVSCHALTDRWMDGWMTYERKVEWTDSQIPAQIFVSCEKVYPGSCGEFLRWLSSSSSLVWAFRLTGASNITNQIILIMAILKPTCHLYTEILLLPVLLINPHKIQGL